MGTLETERPADYLARLAASDLGRAYKALVVDEMDVAAGHHVLDLGCGPGADLAAFAAAVGPEGRVMGLDSDPDAVREAEHLATAWPQVTVEHGDVHSLRLPDHSVHRVHTDRVLQHVEDPDVAVGEVARVLAPSGLACFAEPDWDTLVIDHPEAAIAAAYRSFVTDEVVRNARIGRRLPALCERHGLRVGRVIPITAVFRDVTEADRVLGFERVTGRAVAAGYLDARQAARWLAHLRTGPFFASVTLFVTIAAARRRGGPE
ncbi:methyltransferase domain-containing protein [Nocardioides ungokensis]